METAAKSHEHMQSQSAFARRRSTMRSGFLWPVILALMAGSLAACADHAMQEARARRQAFLAGLVGRTEVDGHRFLAYNQPVPFSDFSFGPPVAICQTTVEIYQGKVQSASMHGYC